MPWRYASLKRLDPFESCAMLVSLHSAAAIMNALLQLSSSVS
jgi:hypothetical protein